MKLKLLAIPLSTLFFFGCDSSVLDSRNQILPDGGKVRVMSINLSHTLGDDPSKDSMVLTYVSNDYTAGDDKLLAEAWKVFPLIKSTCELWGLKSAQLDCLPTMSKKGDFKIFYFKQANDGSWSYNLGSGHGF